MNIEMELMEQEIEKAAQRVFGEDKEIACGCTLILTCGPNDKESADFLEYLFDGLPDLKNSSGREQKKIQKFLNVYCGFKSSESANDKTNEIMISVDFKKPERRKR